MFDETALTPKRLKIAAGKITFGILPREYRFYAGDFIGGVSSVPLTVTIFPSSEATDMAYVWTAACFCHFENTYQSSEFLDSLAGGIRLQRSALSEFHSVATHWIDKLNPELKVAIEELRGLNAKVQDSYSISNPDGVKSVVGIAQEQTVLFIWTEALAKGSS